MVFIMMVLGIVEAGRLPFGSPERLDIVDLENILRLYGLHYGSKNIPVKEIPIHGYFSSTASYGLIVSSATVSST